VAELKEFDTLSKIYAEERELIQLPKAENFSFFIECFVKRPILTDISKIIQMIFLWLIVLGLASCDATYLIRSLETVEEFQMLFILKGRSAFNGYFAYPSP